MLWHRRSLITFAVGKSEEITEYIACQQQGVQATPEHQYLQ